MMKIKDIILGLIIAVIFVMFCAYGMNLFYKSPNYNNYCPNYAQPYNDNQTSCLETNGTWIPQNIECIKAPCPQGYCDYFQKCQPLFDEAEKGYSQNIFIISLIISLIVIILSLFIIKAESVSSGLMLGSLFFIIYGTARYWRFMEDWGRFILLGIILSVLIYAGYKISKHKR